MNRSTAGFAMALLVTLTLVSGCQGYRDGSRRTMGEFTDDVGIQSRVKLALVNDADIKGLMINTEVSRGVVTLSGRVASKALKQRAVGLASAVKGVREVEDHLTIVTE